MRTSESLVQALLASLIVAVTYASVWAQSPTFTMKPGSAYDDGTALPQIIGGTKAVPSEWPATFVFQNPKGGSCTSTAVGERLILTAAHCIPDGSQGIVEWNGKNLTTSCHHHPGYRDGIPSNDPAWAAKVSPDFALCVTDTRMPQIIAENVDRTGAALKKSGSVHLLGFGCNKEGGTDGGFGVLYEGDATITTLPSQGSYYTEARGGAAVCYGDSGGGAFLFLNQAQTRRLLMGVNSRGDISKVSLLSTTSVKGFVDWAIRFAEQHGTAICGLQNEATGCRPS